MRRGASMKYLFLRSRLKWHAKAHGIQWGAAQLLTQFNVIKFHLLLLFVVLFGVILSINRFTSAENKIISPKSQTNSQDRLKIKQN